MSTSYIPLSDLIEPSLYLNNDNTINYEKLYSQFPLPLVEQGKEQSKRIPNTFQQNKYSSTYRSSYSTHHLVDRVTPELNSLHDHFEKSVELHPDFDCFGTRFQRDGVLDDSYTFETYKEIQIRRNNLGSGIRNLVGKGNDETFIVSVFSSNRAEWVISSLAIQAFGLSSTALYDTLGPSTSKYILDFTESPILITTYAKLLAIIELKKSQKLDHLKYLICMDKLDFNKDYGLISFAFEAGLKLMDFKQLEKIGELNPQPLQTPKDLFCVSFTSGTTGNPKGVLVTQKMAIAAMAFSFGHIDKPRKHLKQNERQIRYFCFLPLAHIYELMDIYLAISAQYKIYFPYDPSPLKILEHLKLIKPHYLTLVPRVYSKFESALKQNLSESFVGNQIISKIINSKNSDSALLDSLIFSKIRHKLGFDSVDFCCSGSAPISIETFGYLKSALNVKFKQGYGLTESFAGICMSQSNDTVVTSGPICVSTEMKLKDIPDMNYTSTDSDGKEFEEPQGELLLRGPQIFEGYYKNPEATNESFDDGWFRTGDIAKIDKLGRIIIVDRVKNFFKLAQGEYVTPERIENIYLSSCSSLLSQCFVHGDSLKTYLVGILGIDINNVRKVLKNHPNINFNLNDDKVLLEKINDDPEIKRYLLKLMNKFIKDDGLQGFEKLHNFKLKIDPLNVEDDNITPTFKIKRNKATNFFRKELDALYEEGSLLKDIRL